MLLMRIAIALGKSLREVEAFDADEVLWWEAMFCVDPPGEQRMDERFAMLAQMVAAFSGSVPKREAFMLYPQTLTVAQEAMQPEELNAVMLQAQSWMQHGDDNRQA